jgi:PhoH-like ATPase
MAATQKKIFVIDTSVIIFDHMSIHNFQEHDIAIPIAVLEELDNFKKGNDSRNFEARSFIRMLDEIGGAESLLDEWVPLNGKNKGRIMVAGHLGDFSMDAEVIFGEKKNDHKIINSAIKLKEAHPKAKVVLVTKDICLRVKAKSMNLFAEDYKTGKIKDADDLYTGKRMIENVDNQIIDDLFEDKLIDYKDLGIEKPYHNQFFILRNMSKSVLGFYNSHLDKIERIDKEAICKIKPRNAEQTFAIHALMNPKIQLITLRGMAGTGKTLLAIAAAIEQKRNFQQIYITRPVIPLGNNDIGFLPGDIKSKMDPYMQPIFDNIKYIKNQYGENDGMTKKINQMIEQEKIAIAPLAYIRGRTLSNAFL